MAVRGEEQIRIGPYRLVRRLGSGGMGTVFEAEDTGLGHRVAVKLMHPHLAARPGAVQRFLREGRAVARIRHPNVVQVFALGLEGESPYLAMEFLHGDDLSRAIAREGRLSVEAALELVLPVVAAVVAAHEAGVIHRDLKPSNICITQGPAGQPCPKVVDFGVSKVIAGDGAEHVTASNSVVGTTAYMAPEQLRAAGNASFRSDQYSLAALLYQCVTGGLPFAGANVYQVMESIMTTPLEPPSARASGIPPALDAAVLRAMSRDPEGRFPSIRAFGGALLPLASERTRLALRAELDERPEDGAGTDSSEVVTTDAPSLCTDRDVTALGDTPVPIASRRRPTGPSPRGRGVVWPFAVTLVVGLAGMAFCHEPSGASGVAAPARSAGAPRASPTAPAESIPRDPSPQGPGAAPQGVPQALSATSPPVTGLSLEAGPQSPRSRPFRRPSPLDAAPPAPLGDNDAPILP